MKSRLSAPRRTSRGVALIITLFFLVLVSIVVIGFIGTARVDRVAAGSHFERMRAQTLANEGVQAVMSTLQRETCDVPYNNKVSDYIPRNWISGPGMLEVTDPNTTSRTRLSKKVLLSSGAPSAAYLADTGIDLTMRPPDLNIELLVDHGPQGTPTHLLNEQLDQGGKVVKMRVRWVYVRKDGTYDLDSDGLPTEAPSLTNTVNPIIGRFGYWADDESAKINYNLAWTKDTSVNTNPPGDPTRIDLRALPNFTSKIANDLHGFITPDNFLTVKRFFNSPFDARLQADDEMRTALDLNKFNLTHYNSDPDTTYYGRGRMMLTTQLSNAVMRDPAGNVIMQNGQPLTRPFLDILKNPSQSLNYIDPGITGTASATVGVSNGNIDATKLNTVINDLVNNYLKRKDWPMVDVASSIQDKYYGNYALGTLRDQRLAQIALDIIDYVRSAESQLTVVQPIRAKWLGSGTAAIFTPDFVNQTIQGSDDTFKGLTRAPHITEMSMWVSPTPQTINGKSLYRSVALVEVYLPTNYGISGLDYKSTDNKTWQLYFDEMNRKDPSDNTSPLYYRADGKTAAVTEATVLVPANPSSSQAFVWDTRADPTNGSKASPGQYRTFAMEIYRTKSAKDLPTVTLRAAITLAGGPRIDVAPLATPLTLTLDQNAATEMDVTSYETADPRVNGVTLDWTLNNSTSGRKNTFGSQNKARTDSLAAPMTINGKALVALQDVDANGKISTESMRMPPPYVQNDATTGRVRSAGELGLIHTGVEGSNTVKLPGVPWRSLHLQPSNLPASVVPDWAFMDLFTVPARVPTPLAAAGMLNPHSNSAGGRVNVNAKPDVFTDIQRIDPLVAVLIGAQTSTLNTNTLDAGTAKTIATNIYNHTLATPTGTQAKGKLYPSSTSGPNVYESPGEIAEIAGVADRGEESEQLIREISNLITARGNTFAVYTVGQALKQTPAGKLVITGEQRQEAILERYQINKGTTIQDDDSFGLRTVYFRNLTP